MQDKRGEPGNLVNGPNLNNKRQQKTCSGCLRAVAAVYNRPSSAEGLRAALGVNVAGNVHRVFALVPVMHKRATLCYSPSVGGGVGE